MIEIKDKTTVKKRVDIVSLKMVKEASILYSPRKIQTPEDIVELCRIFLEDKDRESMIAISLDTKNQPTNITTVSVGTLNASIAHPREIYKTAIKSNANSIIIAHNHPSGDTKPSREDREVTRRLKKAGEILGINLLDHIIIGTDNEGYYSFKKEAIL